jgi:uncharacterized ParB-like nuclease family protein
MIPVNISSITINDSSANQVQEFYARNEAERLFARAHIKSFAYKVGELLTGRSHRISQLHQAKQGKDIRTQHYEGVRTVPVDRILGSENREHDFDKRFHPLRKHTKSRWTAIATEMLLGRELPPVDLIKLNDVYFVRDGHHRVSAAQAMGQKAIDANVTTWKTA